MSHYPRHDLSAMFLHFCFIIARCGCSVDVPTYHFDVLSPPPVLDDLFVYLHCAFDLLSSSAGWFGMMRSNFWALHFSR